MAKYSKKDATKSKSKDKKQDKVDYRVQVVENFEKARKYIKDNYQKNWQDYWKCYNLIRTRTGYDGISDDFVPETFTIIESIKANIAGGKPKFNFVPMREEQNQDTEILNNLLSFYWDQNRMTHKTQSWVQDALVYGTGILMIHWDGDMPRITNVPLDDFFVDPTATHMNNPSEQGYPRYAGRRYLADIDRLREAQIINPETGEMEAMYDIPDTIEEMSQEWDKLDKDQKEMFIGSTLGKDANKHQGEVIEYFTPGKDAKKCVVLNRKHLIYEGENPYQRDERTEEHEVMIDGVPEVQEVTVPKIEPFLPFAALRNYIDQSLFYAKGDVAIIIDRQETLNDISNQKQDNITFVLNNMWQIDPQFQHLAEQIESVPGAVYPIPRGALAPIEKQMVTAEADTEMLRIKDEMRRATAADEVVQGASQDKGRITATEVQAQINQANQRFNTKINTLEDEGYAQVGRIIFKMVQIFLTQETAVRILGPEGVEWKDFDPNDYSGEYEPKVELEATTRAVKAEEGEKFLRLHELAANHPLVNQKEFLRLYFEKVFEMDDDQTKRLLEPDPQQMQQQAMAQAMAGGGQGGGQAQNPMGVPSGPLPTGAIGQ